MTSASKRRRGLSDEDVGSEEERIKESGEEEGARDVDDELCFDLEDRTVIFGCSICLDRVYARLCARMSRMVEERVSSRSLISFAPFRMSSPSVTSSDITDGERRSSNGGNAVVILHLGMDGSEEAFGN